MKKSDLSIQEAARLAGMSSETLRHYDRIGLVRPSGRDPQTGYRRYTPREVALLQTVHTLRRMDLSLGEIKTVLDYNDLDAIIDLLKQAERRADAKIAELRACKEKLRFVRTDYEKKLTQQQEDSSFFTKEFPRRVILLSDTLERPSLDTLWNYLSAFYAQLDSLLRDQFDFEDLAGTYTGPEGSRLFAVCTRYTEAPGLKVLPAGIYLCANCMEENRLDTLDRLLSLARSRFGARPDFTLELVVISGILRWTYQLQLCVEKR